MTASPFTFDVCALEELQRKRGLAFPFRHPSFGQHEVAVFYDGIGVYALENSCPHSFGQLHYGEVKERKVICPLHAAVFDLATGACLDHFTDDTTAYRTEVRDGRVYVIAPGETRG